MQNLLEEAGPGCVRSIPRGSLADRLEDAGPSVLSLTWQENRLLEGGAAETVYHYHPRYRRQAVRESAVYSLSWR